MRLLLFNFVLLVIASALSFRFFQGYKMFTPANLKILSILAAFWLFFSLVLRKYRLTTKRRFGKIINRITLSNLVAFTAFYITMYLFSFSRPTWKVLLTVFILTTFIELIYGYFYFWLKLAQVEPEFIPDENERSGRPFIPKINVTNLLTKQQIEHREFTLLHEIGREAYQFIYYYAALDTANTLLINTSSDFNIRSQLTPEFDCIINVRKVNDIRRINKFFEAANDKLPEGGLFIGLVETMDERKKRVLRKYPPVLNYIIYGFDFIFKRVAPKFIITKKLYFAITRGLNRILSKAETYGRLYSCGFELIDEKEIRNFLYFIAVKVKSPLYPGNPSYGPFIALKRVGRGGKIIRVYKLRTMHPYAEYLQDYVYKRQGLQSGGKFRDDFRISTLGKIFRKLWIDELPMLLNLLNGDLKLVGVRPLSQHYFELYSEELKQMRIKTRPGLIPPFYADNPRSFDEIMQSEKEYLAASGKHPLLTDIQYFFRIIYNIIFRHYRSS